MAAAVGLAASVIGGAILGLAGAGLGTSAGRAVVVTAGLRAANAAIHGRLTVDSVGGSVIGGLDARGVSLVGEGGAPFVSIARLRLAYRLTDLLHGRLVLGQLTLQRPQVDLVQGPGGRFNFAEIFGTGTPDTTPGSRRRRPLIAFSDVRVDSGVIRIRTRDARDTARIDERRITIANAEFPYVRLSSPLARDSALRLDVGALSATVSSPALHIRDAVGRVQLVGDSVALDLARAALPGTNAVVRGAVWNLSGTAPRIALDLRARHVSFADLHAWFPILPVGLAGTGRARVTSHAANVIHVEAPTFALAGVGGGRITGRFGIVLGPEGRWTLDSTDVTMTDFNLAYFKTLLDTIPLVGTLTGTAVAQGPHDALRTRVDWVFHDARRPTAPSSELAGRGVVGIGGPGQLTFHGYDIRRGHIALATVREILPSVALRGVLDGVGTLDGPWRAAEFSGSLRQVDDTLPASIARGVIRFDGRRDTLGIWADLTLDSLRFAGLRPSYPGVPLSGAYGGEIKLAGYLNALAFTARVAGAEGAVRGHGTLTLVGAHYGVRDLDLTLGRFAPADLRRRLPRTAFSGRVRGRIDVDSTAAPSAMLDVALDSSVVGGLRFDSVRTTVRAADSVLVADTLALWAAGIAATGHGGLGLGGTHTDSLMLHSRVDSLGLITPLIHRLLHEEVPAVDTAFGTLRGDLVVSGAMDDFTVRASVQGHRLRWRGAFVSDVHAAAVWESAGALGIALDLKADSLARGRYGFGGIEAYLDGRRDSATWRVRARVGADASMLAGGAYRRDSTGTTVRFDSLAVLAASDVWFLPSGATVAFDDTSVTLTHVALATATGGARVNVDGRLPLRGPGHLTASIEGLPIRDLWAMAQLDPSQAAGEVSGTLDLGGTARAPTLEGSVALRGAVFGEFHAPLMQGTLHYAEQRLRGNVGLWRAGTRIVNVDLNLPLDLALRGVAERRLPGPLTIRANADAVDLSFMDAITPAIRDVRGRLSTDVGITGTWAAPELTGQLTVRDGAATLPALGVRHQDLNGRLVFVGDTIKVDRLRIRSGEGTLDVGGFVRLEGLTSPRLDLSLTAENFKAANIRDFLAMTASGSVRLRGPVVGATLSGRGTVTQGTLYFADILEKNIVNLEDSVLALDSATAAMIRRQGLGADFEQHFLDSLRIDSLALDMGSDVWLRSSEANIQLTGPVIVSKHGPRYRLDGTLQTPRGTYRLSLGPTIVKEFTVTDGRVQYFGTPDLNAALDVHARHRVRTQRGEMVTVLVQIGGTIRSPTLTLSSDIRPPISETEIISYLLFGAPSVQAAGAGTAGYAAGQAVSNIASQITGQLGSTLISDLGVPLDFFEVRPEIGQGGLGGTEIALGRQLGDRVFLTVSPRICPQQQWTFRNLGASVEFRMSNQWRLSASADPLRTCEIGQSALGIGYQFGLDLLWSRGY